MHINSKIFSVTIWVHFDSPYLPFAFSPFSHSSNFFISVNHGFPTFEIFASVEIPTAFACKYEILVLKIEIKRVNVPKISVSTFAIIETA